MTEAPLAIAGQIVEDGPERVRHELHWRVRLPDGRRAVVAQLAPELAAEEVLRRRWLHDVERIAQAPARGIAETIAVDAAGAWRVRVDPPGRRLDDWLGPEGTRRPVDEVVDVVAAIADALAAVHAAGVVARDLEPRAIVVGDDGRVTLTDIGLARLGILSSRTASTLAMESSPWAAPEHLRSTIVDARADVFTLGAILHRALTGVLPATDGIGPLQRPVAVASIRALRADVPEALDELVRRCLAESPDARPATAGEVAAALRGRAGEPGETGGALAIVLVTCQACGAALRAGMRLCLACGKQAVQVRHTPVERGGRYALVLRKVGERVEHTAALRGLYETFGDTIPSLNFLIGDERLYSKKERDSLHRLPTPLFGELTRDDAGVLLARLDVAGLQARVVDVGAIERRRTIGGASLALGIAAALGGVIAIGAGAIGFGLALAIVTSGIVAASVGGIYLGVTRGLRKPPLARLRAAPAALPATDPLVARLAGLLPEVRSPDVRERVAELALSLQRIADHRARVGAAAAAEIDVVLGPVSRLVDAVAAQVRALIDLDADLATLDEGALVRALAASEARGEPAARRGELLAGLDRLRGLEDRRAALLGRLLEAGALLRRAAELAMIAGTEDLADEAEVARAIALLA